MTAHTPDIQMQTVASSQINAIGYDPITSRLRIQFKSKAGPGPVYEYPDVTPEQHQALISAPSIGKYFGEHIKGNAKHPHRKVS